MADPNFSSVSLLLHLDGIDGSQIFTDSGPGSKGVTILGAPSADGPQDTEIALFPLQLIYR